MNRRQFLGEAFFGAAAVRAMGAQPGAVVIDDVEVIDLAKALVRIPSFTTEETELARYLDSLFRDQGLESELQEVDPGRFQTIARLRGTGGGPSLMFNGHIDIDPIPEGMDRDPFDPSVEGDLFHGHGIGNMKGGLAAMITATLAAGRAPVDLRGDIVLACVVGELQGGAGTVRMLESGVRADMAIVTEPIGADTILTKHAGVMQLAIHVVGKTAHISRKEQGVNAIRKMGKVVEALETQGIDGPPDPELPALPLLNVGTILGGRGREVELRGPNIVPDFCSLYVDVRFTQGMTPDTVIAEIRQRLDALAQDDPDLVYEIEFPMKPERRCLREVMMPVSVPPDTPLVEMLKVHVTRVRGREPHVGVKLPISYGGTDMAHLWPAGIPACVYGPAGESSEIGQAISVRELLDCTRVYAAMIEEICV